VANADRVNGTDDFERVVATVRRVVLGPDGPLALAIVLALAALVQVAVTADDSTRTGAMLTALIATLPIALVRRSLILSAALVTFGTLTSLTVEPNVVTLGAIVAQLTVAYHVAERRGRRASAILIVPFLLAAIAPPPGHRVIGVLLLVLVVAAQVLGDGQRQRGQAIAERDATREAMADTLREQAAMEERARIARELHDVVAHHVSMIAVQAETARLTTEGMPDEGKRRLEAIGDTARGALAEMRRLLGVLREDAGGDAELAPQPGLDRLDELLGTARHAGTPVRLIVSGRAAPLAPGVDLSAYRILQEALTNARRHAPGAAVDVELRYEGPTLHLSVRDDGPGATEADGLGLLGMRERAAMVGGSLTAGPVDGGGFLVEAELPTGEPGS
jgi:signal transduction histidine kinase